MSKTTSLRQLAKALGISHTTLSKIANGKYPADSKHITRLLLTSVTGVVVPADKYQAVLTMLDDARFSKFGETSRTASWLYGLVKQANKPEVKNG